MGIRRKHVVFRFWFKNILCVITHVWWHVLRCMPYDGGVWKKTMKCNAWKTRNANRTQKKQKHLSGWGSLNSTNCMASAEICVKHLQGDNFATLVQCALYKLGYKKSKSELWIKPVMHLHGQPRTGEPWLWIITRPPSSTVTPVVLRNASDGPGMCFEKIQKAPVQGTPY